MSSDYLRTLQASNIEKATIDVKKEQRGHMASKTLPLLLQQPQKLTPNPRKWPAHSTP